MTLTTTFVERNADCRATHVGQEADKANDGFEIAQLENTSAGNEHLVVTSIRRDGADDPRTVPAVMALLGFFLADHLDEVALGEQAAQSVFCNHIGGFFYHGFPTGPFSA